MSREVILYDGLQHGSFSLFSWLSMYPLV